MVQVSDAFKKHIYAIERKTTGFVSFEIINPDAYKNNTYTVNSEAPLSKKEQLINKIRTMTHKYATFERDYFQLDGSFHLPPKPEEMVGVFAPDNEYGWWALPICDADGVFAVPPILDITFPEPYSSLGLTLSFDILANEYASDFDIEVYGVGNILTETIAVIGNASPIYTLDQGLDDYTRILIRIKKWAKPYRRARLVEVDFGVVVEYGGDKMISLRILEQVDLLGTTMPSNEMQVVLDNTDRIFNILNPEGIYNYLMPRQEMKATLGLQVSEDPEDIEYHPMGLYYLVEWSSDEGAMTTTLTSRDLFAFLEEIEYTSINDTTLYDLASHIFTTSGIENFEIDHALEEMTTIGFKEPINVREALQHVAIASRSVIYQNREGTLVIKHLDRLTASTGYVTFAGSDMFAGEVTPKVDNDYTFSVLDFNNVFEVPQIILNPSIQSITFKIHDALETNPEIIYENPLERKGEKIMFENPLINTPEQAAIVAEWMFYEYNMRAHYTANWRQNFGLECGDVVLIEDPFEGKKKGRISSQEFNYAGYLEGTTEARGGV